MCVFFFFFNTMQRKGIFNRIVPYRLTKLFIDNLKKKNVFFGFHVMLRKRNLNRFIGFQLPDTKD